MAGTASFTNGRALPDLRPYLDPVRVLLCPGRSSRVLALSGLTHLVGRDWDAERHDGFLASLLAREDVTTTALGLGFAIPHVRTTWLVSCRIAVGVFPQGIDWPSVDANPVQVVALLASRESDHQEHLRIMAALATALRRPGMIDALANCDQGTDVVERLST